MERKALVRPEGDTFLLTPQGHDRARDIIRRHRLAECLFRDTFEIRSNEQIESNACVLEHVLSTEVTESICKFLKHPDHCPHGRIIPRGPCCEKTGQFRIVANS
ncbi:MAG TPA: iron dependent repressor, metal binding and dimerization domain protein [Planctomycetota bacterium]|nr:iron dependent repressor, metal binding and dimerization domain protein [Planctomycetota bacterium]